VYSYPDSNAFFTLFNRDPSFVNSFSFVGRRSGGV
jgi:hypothetical protein